MDKLRITRCVGEGQGECKRCRETKGWNRHWTSFLFKIEGFEGCYCNECVNAILKEMNRKKIGEVVTTVYGWSGIVDAIYEDKRGKVKYRIIDEACEKHTISENSLI